MHSAHRPSLDGAMKLLRQRSGSAPTHRRERHSERQRHGTAPSLDAPKLHKKKLSDRFRRTSPHPAPDSDMQTLVTLKRPPGMSDDCVSMSNAGQFVLPAIFKATPVPPHNDERDPSFRQAAGHGGSFKKEGHTLVKKAPEREADFYEMAQNGYWPSRLIPAYHGRVHPSSIKIENLVFSYKRPCVIDIKMGIHTVEEQETNLFKKLKMNALDLVTGSRSEGCRLEGLSMYRAMAHVTGNKAQSHSVSMSNRVTLRDVLTFFLTDESGVRTDVAQRFQQMIQDILHHFAPYRLWSRALRHLHTINPNARISEDNIVGLTRRTKCDVRMIDFAHWNPTTDGTRDEGYILGLNTILDALRSIRFCRAKPIFSMRNAVQDVLDHKAKKRSASREIEMDLPATDGDAFTFDTLWNDLPSASESSLSISDDNDTPGRPEEDERENHPSQQGPP
eukprot:gb/GEZJ01001174.1/.p1 GENE.gb/GEZJ01001174.1/~~gb/GEZJ01001174.1/.p1  ORF type:complete len:489 (-),score=67.07 gb/GEZJ01001174.1/:619-1962(-)